ncbi:MAG: hypothetical protein LUE27_09475 [Clostridia bacterium]|nr:hypothetical protein [Clostridia bacterium]
MLDEVELQEMVSTANRTLRIPDLGQRHKRLCDLLALIERNTCGAVDFCKTLISYNTELDFIEFMRGYDVDREMIEYKDLGVEDRVVYTMCEMIQFASDCDCDCVFDEKIYLEEGVGEENIVEAKKEFDDIKDTIQYKLCKSCLMYLEEIWSNMGCCWMPTVLIQDSVVDLFWAMWLYTALKNEKEKIKEEAAVQGVQLTEPATDALNLPIEAMKPSGRANIPKQEKRAVQATEMVFIKRATKYFDKAVAAGMMEQDGDKYTWVYIKGRGHGVSLAYFLKKIYNPDETSITPFKQLELLFGVKSLAATTNNILGKHPKWSTRIDELFAD